MLLKSLQLNVYLAGFLDGDGSIYVRAKPNTTYRYGYQIALYIAFFQSSSCKDFPAMCEEVGYGKIRLRKDGIYEFTISKQDEIIDFLAKVSPYLKLKQKQAKLMLEILQSKREVKTDSDFKKLLEKIDKFRDLNYSKNRKKRLV